MADIYTPEERSKLMSGIRSVGTKPEERLNEMVDGLAAGRWPIQRNVRELPGTPDVVIPSLRVAIFADGCFFHLCPKHGHIPKSNVQYWEPKLRRTVQRDRRNCRKLRRLGYAVWRFWEHDLTPSQIDRATAVLARRLDRRAVTAESEDGAR